MKLRLLILYTFLGFVNNLSCQYICDTIYSGKNLHNDLSSSISNKLFESLSNKEFCFISSVSDSDPKELAPFLINKYDKYLKDFDAIIYHVLCNDEDIIKATFFFEIFYNSESKARHCFAALNKLKIKYESDILKDKIESDDDMVGSVGVINWYIVQKENVVYFIHRRLPDTASLPIKIKIQEELLKFLKHKKN